MMELRWSLREENKEKSKKESKDNKERSEDSLGESQEKGTLLFTSC